MIASVDDPLPWTLHALDHLVLLLQKAERPTARRQLLDVAGDRGDEVADLLDHRRDDQRADAGDQRRQEQVDQRDGNGLGGPSPRQ